MKIAEFDICVSTPLHGIPKSGLTGPTTARLDSSWVGPFNGEAGLLCEHIRRSVEIAATHSSALWIPSGADTKGGEVLGRSEAMGAFEIARDHNWFGHPEMADR